ncbi:hypothetical protein [Paenibacillus macerans]|uniref:hypothetical protein n=1 Tax=Paenibacillus macerans TaxID=44252 RepID=UPI003D32009C
MEPLQKETAKDILSPYISQIQDAVKRAINNYYLNGQYSNVRHIHSARSAASLCHDHIKAELKQEFESTPGVSYSEKRGLFTLNIQGSVVLRFKKFNKHLMSSNIQTKQVTAYVLQQPAQLELEEMPPYGLLHVGYVMNKLGTGIEKIYVTYRYANVNIWEWDTSENTVIQPVLTLPNTPAASSARRKVKAKENTTQTGDEHASNS